MKLNNKGFALTSIIYMLIVLFLILLLLLLANLASRKTVLDKVKYDVKDKLNQGGVTQTEQTLYDVLLMYYYSNENPGKNGYITTPGKETPTQNEGLIKSEDDSGITYYFRGNTDNNYVYFADKIFRIIRINGDGTIRLVLNEDIGTKKYNTENSSAKYVGYTMDRQSDEINSNVKTYLDDWYNGTGEFEGQKSLIYYDNKISSTNFCNDTSTYIDENIFGQGESFSAQKRLNPTIKEEIYPVFNCQPTKNFYGGNYNIKVGLLTADEIAYAGGIFSEETGNNYLQNNETYITMTPARYQDGGETLASLILRCYAESSTSLEECSDVKLYGSKYDINKDGVVNASDASAALSIENTAIIYALSNGNIKEIKVNEEYKIKPVINLNRNVIVLSGNGTQENPYMIKEN